MNKPQFTIQEASGIYLHLPIFDNDVEMADGDVCILLNEQQATIQSLKEENDNCRNDYRELFSNYVALEEENKQLKQKLENLDLNEKNDSIKMIDGKVFIRM